MCQLHFLAVNITRSGKFWHNYAFLHTFYGTEYAFGNFSCKRALV